HDRERHQARVRRKRRDGRYAAGGCGWYEAEGGPGRGRKARYEERSNHGRRRGSRRGDGKRTRGRGAPPGEEPRAAPRRPRGGHGRVKERGGEATAELRTGRLGTRAGRIGAGNQLPQPEGGRPKEVRRQLLDAQPADARKDAAEARRDGTAGGQGQR